MKKIIVILVLICTNANAQKFIDIKTKTTYKFPKLIYPENPKVEEKINNALQIDFLLRIPNDNEPFSEVTNRSYMSYYFGYYREIIHYTSWKNISNHPNIIALKIKGKEGKKAFTSYTFFDKRTGYRFWLNDLFTKKIKRKNISFNNNTLKINNKEIAIKELKNLTDFGKNILSNTSEIVKRKNLRGKTLFGTGQGVSDIMEYFVYISEDEKGNTKISNWSKKHRDLLTYEKSSITENSLDGDFEDLGYSLHLKKEKNETWIGELQLGSPFYTLTFKEY